MAHITKEEFDKIAGLAKLSFDKDEYDSFKADLERLTGFAENVNLAVTEAENDVDVSVTEGPAGRPEKTLEGLREDVTASSLSHADALRNAENADGYFKVNRVI